VPGTRDLLSSTDTAGAAGGDEADLLAGRAVAANGGRVTNVLMVTTTVRMLNGVTGNTTNLGPAVVLGAETVEGVTGLEDGLLDTATASNDADHSAALGGDGLLLTGGELEAAAAGLGVVGDDDAVVTAGTGDGGTVTSLSLDVADDATLGDVAEGHDVADGELGLGSTDDGLAGEHTLAGNEELLDAAVLVGVAELDAGQGGTTTGVVLNGLHDSTHETVTLGVIQDTETGGSETAVSLDLVHGTLTATASEDGLSHRFNKVQKL